MNNQYSEYLGCLIFQACGLSAQETVMGNFTDKDGKAKIVVGCKDFTQDGSVLYEFSKIGNQTMVNDARAEASIESVYAIISNSDFIIDKESIIDAFWDMFVIDTLIGNGDRHLDNWGILENDGKISFAPIYDCGSSLSALLDDDSMKSLLANPTLFKNQEFNITSCYSMEGKRIFYHEIFKNPPTGLQEAIKRVVPKIDMGKIRSIVDAVPQMHDIRKDYLNQALDLRYEQILAPALKRVLEHE